MRVSKVALKRGELVRTIYLTLGGNRKGTVLDFGFGEGGAVFAFQQIGCTVIAYDTSSKFINLLRSNMQELGCTNVFVTDTWHDLEKRYTGKIDFVIMSDVYEHLEEPEKELARITAIMSPESRLFIAVPNRLSLLLFFLGDPHFRCPFINILGKESLNFVTGKILKKNLPYYVSNAKTLFTLRRTLQKFGFHVTDITALYYQEKFNNVQAIENRKFRHFARHRFLHGIIQKHQIIRMLLVPYIVVIAQKYHKYG
ncbi:MAG: class I SAM-dependent methyltransferase [bacterium]